ncbi:MAG TPA: hypothetical protein VD970_17150 [Acetobacteraceae bacterium]|nr:hypothetical protein [Acetobacteraceae bacterium]
MRDSDSLDFEWGGIAFRLLPRCGTGSRSDGPVLLHWRHPSGLSGSQHFAGVTAAMQHSLRLIEIASPHLRRAAS